jgi:TRAP transporter solute receptor, TAXI family
MKKALTIAIIALMALMLVACGGKSSASSSAPSASTSAATTSTPAPAPAPKKVARYSIGTSSNGGNFYLIGGGLATVLNNNLGDQMVITSEETGGSTANLSMIESGDMEIGFAMTSAIYEGLNGTAKWCNGKPMTKVRGLLPLYPSYLTMYCLETTPVQSLTDYNGKIVGLGSKGAAMDNVLRGAFEKMGIKPASIFNDGHGATASAVSQGRVDVAVLFSYPPFAAITELEATKKLRFIPLSDSEQQFLVDNYPFYAKADMPKGSYGGVTSDVKTVSEWNMLVCSADLSEDTVYNIVKVLFENNPDLLAVHKSLSNCTPENALFFNVPLHKGVVKYLTEVGIDVPSSLKD